MSQISDETEVRELSLGLSNTEDSSQIINQDGWHVATVEISPTVEVAARIVSSFNGCIGIQHPAIDVPAAVHALEELAQKAREMKQLRAYGHLDSTDWMELGVHINRAFEVLERIELP